MARTAVLNAPSRQVTVPGPRRHFRSHPWATAYTFIAPNLVLFSAFSFFPLLYAFWISFHDWSLIGDAEWIGLGNYRRLLTDTQFWHALLNTAVYAVASVPTTMAIGLLLAVALNRRLPGRVFLRSVYFLPVVVSAVATGTIAAWLFNEHYGVINALLVQAGVGRIPWLSSTAWALPSLVIATMWVRVGFCMVVYLAALQSIPSLYYEAAVMDGAGPLRQFRAITLPLLRPATFLLLVLSVIHSFQVFDLIYVMTGGGPGFSTTMLVQYIFQSAFVTSEMGYASTIGVVLYAIVLIFTLVQWRVSRQGENVL
ncbi:carbohydrate ABC transporter permease [Roseomonas elaeocarpi]|uniref:Carbohydrate ABC transporter permease n=1 Tax=Roseomonas elaeocarpi TaxID=907779 RepID=A0ABV6JSK7_9PROT